MDTETASSRAHWLRTLVPVDDCRTRLVILPHAGGTAGFYRPFAEHLSGLEVLAAQYPGRQDRIRENSPASIEQIALAVIDELDRLPVRTTLVMGHSMGSLVAFEVARRRPDLVDGLIVSAHRGPSVPSRSRLHLADDAALIEEVRRMGGTDELVLSHPELVGLVTRPLRADLTVDARYQCPDGARVATPITVLRGSDDATVTEDDALAWQKHCDTTATCERLPGGHFFLLDAPRTVAAVVAREAARTGMTRKRNS